VTLPRPGRGAPSFRPRQTLFTRNGSIPRRWPSGCAHGQPAPPRWNFATGVGGRLRIEIEDYGLSVFVTGTYVIFDRPNRISFTWRSSAWEAAYANSVVTVSLEPHGEGHTMITIHHVLLPPPYVEAHENGWGLVAAQLEARLTAG
jgi:uncharacterized protein YndB with AHSA1/START domain